ALSARCAHGKGPRGTAACARRRKRDGDRLALGVQSPRPLRGGVPQALRRESVADAPAAPAIAGRPKLPPAAALYFLGDQLPGFSPDSFISRSTPPLWRALPFLGDDFGIAAVGEGLDVAAFR